jgi:8-oxo-dGTP diphosphatase
LLGHPDQCQPLPTVHLGYEGLSKRHVHVACGIIERDGLVLATRRSAAMSLPFKWEFPGGKLEAGESPQVCLHRELREELGVQVAIAADLPSVTHHYPDFTCTLYPFICTLISDELTLHEHDQLTWRLPAQLSTLDWLAADLPVLAAYLERLADDSRLIG